jgi:hypothetical protein
MLNPLYSGWSADHVLFAPEAMNPGFLAPRSRKNRAFGTARQFNTGSHPSEPAA